MGMKERAQGQYVDVEENLNTGSREGISKGYSGLGADTQVESSVAEA